jgi:hypothetical protein
MSHLCHAVGMNTLHLPAWAHPSSGLTRWTATVWPGDSQHPGAAPQCSLIVFELQARMELAIPCGLAQSTSRSMLPALAGSMQHATTTSWASTSMLTEGVPVQGGSAVSIMGLAPCHLNTSRVGEYSITFSVRDSQGATASATRVLVVDEKCGPGEANCLDGSCSVGE